MLKNPIATPGPYEIQVDGTLSGRGPRMVSLTEQYDDGSPVEIADFGTSEVSDDGETWTPTPEGKDVEANAAGTLLAINHIGPCVEALRGFAAQGICFAGHTVRNHELGECEHCDEIIAARALLDRIDAECEEGKKDGQAKQ